MNLQYPLSLNGETFNSLKTDFDQLLRQLINEMERREEEDATVTIKVAVHMEKDQARDFKANAYDAMRDIIKPTFKHEISTVMQVKNKKNGTLGGNMELVWDRELCQYVMRTIDNGQMSLDDTEPDASEPAALPPAEPAALPYAVEEDEEAIDVEFRPVESEDESTATDEDNADETDYEYDAPDEAV